MCWSLRASGYLLIAAACAACVCVEPMEECAAVANGTAVASSIDSEMEVHWRADRPSNGRNIQISGRRRHQLLIGRSFQLNWTSQICSFVFEWFWVGRRLFIGFPRAETINIFLVLGRLWIANEAARHRFRVPSLLLLLSGQPPRAVRLKATPDYYVSGCRSVWIDGQTGLSRSLFHYFGLVLFHLSACVIHSSIGRFRMATNRATISAIRWRRC